MTIGSSIRIFYAFILLMFGSIGQAYAANPAPVGGNQNAIEIVLCNVVDALTGPIGRMVGTIAIIALAIGLFLGKLSWGLAVATGIGVAMLLGAATVVNWLGKNIPGNVGTSPLDGCPGH